MTRHRLMGALGLAVLLTALAVAGASMVPRVQKQGSLYRIERGDMAYGFDAAWRVEILWARDTTGRWEKVKSPAEGRLEPLRRSLLSSMGKNALWEIPAEGKAEIQSLKSLGYL